MPKAIPLEYVENRIREIRDEIADREKDLNRLRPELAALNSVKKAAVAFGPVPSSTDAAPHAGGTTGMIFEFITSHPGHLASEIADELEEKITSSSSDKRRVISASITNLINRGKVTKRSDGSLYAVESEQLALPPTPHGLAPAPPPTPGIGLAPTPTPPLPLPRGLSLPPA